MNANKLVTEFLKSKRSARSFLEGKELDTPLEEDMVSSDFSIPPATTPPSEEDEESFENIEEEILPKKKNPPKKESEESEEMEEYVFESEVESRPKTKMVMNDNFDSVFRLMHGGGGVISEGANFGSDDSDSSFDYEPDFGDLK